MTGPTGRRALPPITPWQRHTPPVAEPKDDIVDPVLAHKAIQRYTTSAAELPRPRTELWDWQLHALCRGSDTAVFFPPTNLRGPARTRIEYRAKRICQDCPVLTECREHALEAGEPYGVWGGMTARERALHPRRLLETLSC